MKPLSIIILCLFFFSCKEKKADNDWGKMDLHGKVKMLVEKDYVLDTTGENKGKHLRWTKIYVFNTHGQVTDRAQLNEKGEPVFKFINTYDAAGRLKEEKAVEDPQKHVTSYQYDTIKRTTLKSNSFEIQSDDAKRRIKYTVVTLSQFNLKGILLSEKNWMMDDPSDTSIEKFSYNKKQYKNKSVLKNSDLEQTTVYSYDDHGNCISEVADTALPHRAIRTIRKFDEKDNLIEEISYEADGSIHSQKKMEYRSFDKAGNWLVQYIHWKDLGTTVIERSIEYYP